MMNIVENGTTMNWVLIDGKECLKFHFSKHFTNKEAGKISEAWIKEFSKDPKSKHVVIFDAKEMKEYEPMARNAWQATIKQLKNQIESIYVVTDSDFISAGAKIMGVFTSFSIRVVRSSEHIVFSIN